MNIVFLAAREILQRRAIAFLGHGAHVHLQALQPETRAGLVGAVSEDFVHARMGDKPVQRGLGPGPAHQQVEIADGLLAPAQAARRRHSFHARSCAEIRRQLLGRGRGEAE